MTTTLDDDLVAARDPQGPASRRERRSVDKPLVAILVIAGIVRFGFGIFAMDGPVPESWTTAGTHFAGDQYSYWYYGNEIAHGNGYVSYVPPYKATSYYPIGYPATLATVFWLQDHTPIPDDQPMAVALLHAAMSTATVFFVWLIARAALGRRLGLLAALLVALFPNLIFNVPTYTLETAFVFWSTAALAVIVTHDWATGPPSTRRLLAFGTVLGLSVLTRPFSLPFVVGLVLALVVTKVGWRRVLTSVAWTMLPVVALLTPWTIRNFGAMHAFVPISTNLGDTACLDRSMDADGGFRWAGPPVCAEGTDEAKRSSENISKAISFIVNHPAKEIELMGKRFGRMLEHDHSGLQEAESVNFRVLDPGPRRIAINVADWWFWLTMAASAIGLVGLLRRGPHRPERLLVAVAFLFLLLLPIELWGNVRFHIPVLPFAAITAAALPLAFRRGVARSDSGNTVSDVELA